MRMDLNNHATLYDEITREMWAQLADTTPLPLTAQDIESLRSLGDKLDVNEVDMVYRPISRLLNMYVESVQRQRLQQAAFLRKAQVSTPFVIGVAGSVAVGKSTTARVLRELLARWPTTPKVQLITTDGFLLPNAELEKQGLLERKGFPESYDRRALLKFMAEIKSGKQAVRAPVYSHLIYDVLPDEFITIDQCDVLIVEGLNVLQPPLPWIDGRTGLSVSDFFDFSIYVDAREKDIRYWFVKRFLMLRSTAFSDPDSFFKQFAQLPDEEAIMLAEQVWDTINGPNLRENVLPTRGRANLILRKGQDHAISSVLLRRL